MLFSSSMVSIGSSVEIATDSVFTGTTSSFFFDSSFEQKKRERKKHVNAIKRSKAAGLVKRI